MKNITKIALVGALFLTSCTKDFNEMNTNPNTTIAANPESLLAPTIYDLVSRNANRAERIGNELMQYTVTTNDSREFHRYVIRPSESDYMWRNWYLQRTNILDIYKNAEITQQAGYQTYMGISLVLDAWVMSMITDMFGDVPFSEANQGNSDNNLTPKFDPQQEVYAGIFAKLEEANTLLAAETTTRSDGSRGIPEDVKSLEPLYQGNALLWRKFGNSLYLRLLMRVSGRPELDPINTIKKIVDLESGNYPIMQNNQESAVLRFTSTAPLTSPFNTWRDFDWNGDAGYSEFFINTLGAWGDPRLPILATEYTLGLYSGIPSGYNAGNVPERQSAFPIALKNEPRLGNILNYPELQFILSEAALKGFINNSPKAYYDNGVVNALTFWEAAVPEGHLAKPAIAWNESESMEQKMNKIFTQKYFTLFFTDFQAWHEFKRTGYPTLPIGPGVQNEGRMPERLNYPINVQSLNRASYQEAVARMGGDDLNIKVWWNR